MASLVPAFPSHRMILNWRDQMTGSLMVGVSAAEKPTIYNSAAIRQLYDLPLHSKWGEKGGARWRGLPFTETRQRDEKWLCGISKKKVALHQAASLPLFRRNHSVFWQDSNWTVIKPCLPWQSHQGNVSEPFLNSLPSTTLTFHVSSKEFFSGASVTPRGSPIHCTGGSLHQ